VAHEQWRWNLYGGSMGWELEQPEQFEEAARFVRPDDVRGPVLVSADLGWLTARLAELLPLGADLVHLHHVSNRVHDQCRFVDTFGASVLPELAAA
jgi:coenzyme F420-dependent glucose-6-phosphate dehydrogenase